MSNFDPPPAKAAKPAKISSSGSFAGFAGFADGRIANDAKRLLALYFFIVVHSLGALQSFTASQLLP
jgi:hypothetical protein